MQSRGTSKPKSFKLNLQSPHRRWLKRRNSGWYASSSSSNSWLRTLTITRLLETKECLLRYLRASKWSQETTIKRLEASLAWRRDYGLYSFLTAEHVEPEVCHSPSRSNFDYLALATTFYRVRLGR